MIAEIIIQQLKTNNKAKCRIIRIDHEQINKTQELVISPEIIDDVLKAGSKVITVSITQMEVIDLIGIKQGKNSVFDIYDMVQNIVGNKVIGKGKLAVELQKSLNCCEKTVKDKIRKITREGYLIEEGHYNLKLNQEMYQDDFKELV